MLADSGHSYMDLHHVGIATNDLDALCDLYVGLLGCPVVHEETLDGTDVAFLEGTESYLELLEPHEEGVIQRFLEEHGPGIHHLAFRTKDIENLLEHAKTLDVEPVDSEPRQGAWGQKVAYLHPNSTGGVLIELVQDAGEPVDAN